MVRGLLLFVAGCAGVSAAPAPAPPVEHALGAPLAVPGEAMVYEVSLRGLHVARVQVAVGQPGWYEGKRAIIVKSHGETEGLIALLGDLDWTLETTVDLDRGLPLTSVEDAVVTFRGKTRTAHDVATEDGHDLHSSILALRGWRSSLNQHTELDTEIAGAQIELELHDAGTEWLAKPAVRYEGVAHDKFPFKFWVSDDTARVPLRMQTATKWGEVVVALVEYVAPRD